MLGIFKRRHSSQPEPVVQAEPVSAGTPPGTGYDDRPHLNHFIKANYASFAYDEPYMELYEKIGADTAVDIVRLYDLWETVLQTKKLPKGDYLEVGVWRGGSGAVIACAAAMVDPTARVFLADTFEGVVKAGEHDNYFKGGEFSDTSVEYVQSVLTKTDVKNATILQGVFPEENGDAITGPLRLVHIDVDVYQGAKDIVEWAYPRLVQGGLIIFDDYGFYDCAGVSKLVNDLKAQDRFFFIYNANGHAVLLKR